MKAIILMFIYWCTPVKDGEGYLTKQSIEAMRSELAHDIFRQDFANIYEEQAQSSYGFKGTVGSCNENMDR